MKQRSTESTRVRLIEAAMILFARNGLDGVSLRAVNQAAKAKNSGATHYHFKNRLGLIRAMVEHINTATPEEVELIVGGLPINGDKQLEAIARFFGPVLVVRYARPKGEESLGFLSQLLQSDDPDIQDIWEQVFGNSDDINPQLIFDAFPDQDPTSVKRRLIYSTLNIVHGLANDSGLHRTMFGDLSMADGPEALVDLLKYIRGGLGN
ncbi:TetR/AcrR family transcriptional regulator [Parasphingorhabdus cellanae]|uniref:TetR/AcrR family transcriptional regulator n=1 Tax=Parasphingorhabdus cellanae TaxID=2806553 RepID=A0ABX7TA82_9SPHN|nr:TetR/AcrR family transcriptional regulator [Parasphingorhabdus cellanae]QTD57088.1 TetR/AcrR family transcriptional regulator [Parasphingorhabdus cellanae]